MTSEKHTLDAALLAGDDIFWILLCEVQFNEKGGPLQRFLPVIGLDLYLYCIFRTFP